MSKIKQASLEREDKPENGESSRAVTVAETKLPAVSAASIGHADNWDSVPETSGSLIAGSTVKFNFNDSSWHVDKVRITAGVEEDTYAVLDAKAVWVRWGADKKPAEQRVTQPGQRHPERDELPDNDEDEWPLGLKGDPEDPWKDNRYVLMINTLTAAEFTFVTDTHGGRRAVADLKRQITNARRAHPSAIPIVKLSSTLMPTRFGPKPRPVLKVVDWRGGPELAPADEQKQLDQQRVQRYSPDRITTGPQRTEDNNEPPPHTTIPDDEEVPF